MILLKHFLEATKTKKQRGLNAPSVRHRIVVGPEKSDSNSFHDESSIVSTGIKLLVQKDEKQLPFLIRS